MTEQAKPYRIPGFNAYREYLAVKLHFLPDVDYDGTKYNWSTSSSVASYRLRKDKKDFARLEYTFRDKPTSALRTFIAVNFLLDDKVFVKKLLTGSAMNLYREYVEYENRLPSSFKDDVKEVKKHAALNPQEFFTAVKKNDHPEVFKLLMAKVIRPWSYIVLSKVLGGDDVKIADPILWEPTMKKLERFRPFMRVDWDSLAVLELG